MSKTVIRIICLICGAIAMYRTDIKSIIAFVSLMVVIFWVIPEICMFIAKENDE